MARHTANDLARAAQRSHDGLEPADPNDEDYQFACDQVAAELEAQEGVAELVFTLSQSRTLLAHLMSQDVPSDLLPYLRELAETVRDMAARVDAQRDVFAAPDDIEDAA